MICRADMPSDTMARKAQKLLAARGIRSEIIRTRSLGGCTFGLRITGSCEDAARLLRQGGVEIRSMEAEAGLP